MRARSGYYAVDPTDWKKGGDDKKPLIVPEDLHSLTATGVLFFAHTVMPEKKGEPVTVEILVDPSTVSFGSGPEATYATSMDFQVGAFTPAGKLEKIESQTAEANLQFQTYQQLLKNGIPVKIPIQLKPGQYMLRVAARDNRNGRMGSLDVPLTLK